MSTRIHSHKDKLEQVVLERTQELAGVNSRLELLVKALEHAEDGIEVTDRFGIYRYVNPAMERITGYSSQEMLGQSPVLLRSGRLDDAFYQNISDQVSAGNVYKGSFVGRRKDGTFFDQEVTIWPVQDHEGQLVHCVALRRDVTERRKTEHALRVSERMASVGTLAAGAAHEINNPLTYTLLSLSHIERQLLRSQRLLPADFLEQVQQATAYAKEGAQRVQAIVRDLRSFSRVDDVTLQRVDPNTALESALRMLAMDLRHRATLQQRTGQVPLIVCNPAQLSQVLLNLLVNALQALDADDPRPKLIEVVTSTDAKGNALIEISDTGRGIEEANLERIFDPFFTTKPVGEGTGLGLSMCHNLVRAMGGEIQVQSELGKGSTFRIVLPPAPAGAEAAPQSSPRDSKFALQSRILVIDDDRAVAEALRLTLERHDVCVAQSAQAALGQLDASSFDVILCDVMMPEMDGVQLHDRLVARGFGEERSLVFITGGALTASARSFLERSDIVHLVKPLDEQTLEDAIARRRAAQSPARTGAA
jgi:PAS domain S-box-containing protein